MVALCIVLTKHLNILPVPSAVSATSVRLNTISSCILDLVVKELTEVLHIHFALCSVYDGNRTV